MMTIQRGLQSGYQTTASGKKTITLLRVIPPPWHFNAYILKYILTFFDIYIYIYIYSDIWPNSLSDIYSDILSAVLFGILSGIYCGILSGIYSGIISDIYSDILSGILSDILFTWGSGQEEKSMEGIASLQLRSGGDHCDHELALEVRRTTPRSWACCSGPAGTAAITSLQLKSGGEHPDPGLAIRAWRGTLRSSACSWGLVEEEAAEACGRRRDSWYKI